MKSTVLLNEVKLKPLYGTHCEFVALGSKANFQRPLHHINVCGCGCIEGVSIANMLTMQTVK